MGRKDKKKKRAASSDSSEKIDDAERILEDSESGESDMFPGGIDPAAVSGGKDKTAKAKATKPRNPKSNKDSSTGRRIEKEDYKCQRTYKDFVNCHLLNWLDETDPTFLSKDAFKDVRRIKLFSAILFNFGWLPWETKAGENKAAVVRAAHGQYERRNRPAARTGWGIYEMHCYSKWQMNEYKRGRVKKEAMGGWAWKLPAKDPDTGAPAPLPPDVQRFVDNGFKEDKSDNKPKSHPRKRKEVSESDSDGDTDSNSCVIEDYTIMTRSTDKAAMLTQSFGCSVSCVHCVECCNGSRC